MKFIELFLFTSTPSTPPSIQQVSFLPKTKHITSLSAYKRAGPPSLGVTSLGVNLTNDGPYPMENFYISFLVPDFITSVDITNASPSSQELIEIFYVSSMGRFGLSLPAEASKFVGTVLVNNNPVHIFTNEES